jgi:hypothetical protein
MTSGHGVVENAHMSEFMKTYTFLKSHFLLKYDWENKLLLPFLTLHHLTISL